MRYVENDACVCKDRELSHDDEEDEEEEGSEDGNEVGHNRERGEIRGVGNISSASESDESVYRRGYLGECDEQVKS